MKYRKVRVSVFPVRCKAGNRNVPLFDPALLEDQLNSTFGFQTNTWFEVTIKNQITYNYDGNDDGVAWVYSPEMNAMWTSDTFKDDNAQVRIFLIDSLKFKEYVVDSEYKDGYANPPTNAAIITAGGNPNVPNLPQEVLFSTVAHEIGHLFMGPGHPNQDGGLAPFPGTDRSRRLMASGQNRGKLLVKREWDAIEAWNVKNVPGN